MKISLVNNTYQISGPFGTFGVEKWKLAWENTYQISGPRDLLGPRDLWGVEMEIAW